MSWLAPNMTTDAAGVGELLRSLRALIVDWDGTLVAGDRVQPGVVSFFEMLGRRRIGFTVVTNNSVSTPAQFSATLAAAGAVVPPEQVLTSAEATAAYLRRELPRGAPLFVVGESGLRAALSGSGFVVTEDSDQDAAAVVVGGDRSINHDKLKHAIRLIRRGARFIGTNPDLLVPVEDGLAPEAGVLLAAIAAGAGVAPTVIGKPERPLLEQALARMGSTPSATAILGDRLDTDVLGGRRLGLTTILVTTGVHDAAAVAASAIRPDLVVSGLDELALLWEMALQQ